MKFGWIVIAIAGLALVTADAAQSRTKQKAQRRCIEQPYDRSVGGFFWNPAPLPNGCAPPVYVNGQYIGQDPDPFIRSELRRDPRTGFSPY